MALNVDCRHPEARRSGQRPAWTNPPRGRPPCPSIRKTSGRCLDATHRTLLEQGEGRPQGLRRTLGRGPPPGQSTSHGLELRRRLAGPVHSLRLRGSGKLIGAITPPNPAKSAAAWTAARRRSVPASSCPSASAAAHPASAVPASTKRSALTAGRGDSAARSPPAVQASRSGASPCGACDPVGSPAPTKSAA